MSQTSSGKPSGNNENTAIRDFVLQTEAVYKGLGLPVLYGVLSILANKSVFFLGGRGAGKTRAIKCVPEVLGTIVSKWDAFTLGELDILCQRYIDINSVHDIHFVFKVGDFSSLSEYHREIFLTVCSRIVSDGEYRHVTATFNNLNIEDCKLTLLIAIQPIIYSRLCNYQSQWESMSYDRFSKFLFLNPLRNGTTLDEDFVPTLAQENIPPSATVPDKVKLDSLVEMFQEQVSEGRARLYARDYAIAIARFQGKTEVDQGDVDIFYKLFSPYLKSFSKLQTRKNIDTTVTVSSGNIELLTQIGKHLEGITKQQLAESMRLTPRHIERGLALLSERGLIREEDKNYFLSAELERFFRWYRDTFSVQMSPPQPQPENEKQKAMVEACLAEQNPPDPTSVPPKGDVK